MKAPRIGPYFPSADQPNHFCMLGDEGQMFAPLSELEGHHAELAEMMRANILVWAMTTVAFSKPDDVVYLDTYFESARDHLAWYESAFQEIGLETAREIRFVEPATAYKTVLAEIPPDDPIVSVCFSYLGAQYDDLEEALQISKRVNLKAELIERANVAGFRVPKSALHHPKEIDEQLLRDFRGGSDAPVFLKVDGLGGGFNVKRVSTWEEARDFLGRYGGDKIIVQEMIDDSWTECIVDFALGNEEPRWINVRKKLVLGNQWFGNVYGMGPEIGPRPTAELVNCARDVMERGYTSDRELICGLDFFVKGDEVRVSEVNARWTGGIPVVLLLQRLGVPDSQVVSHIDEMAWDQREAYRDFCDKHLAIHGRVPEGQSFGIIPFGFSPRPKDGKTYIWNLIFGSYGDYLEAAKKELPDGCLAYGETVQQILAGAP